MRNPFALFQDDNRRWFKGNTHTHTTLSDGSWTPQETVDWYRQAGYNFLFLTDHEEKLPHPEARADFAGLSSAELLVLPGLEIRQQVESPVPGKGDMHLIALGTARTGLWKPTWRLRDALDFVLSEGGVPIIAHPYYNGLDSTDLADAHGAVGVEVFNTTCDVCCQKGFSRSHWDSLLAQGLPIHGLAADDAHACRQVPDYGGGWIMVKAADLTPHSILEAIREGSFYASTGPQILDVRLEEDCVSVRTTPAARINFIGANGHSSVEHAVGGELIVEAQRPLSSFRRFLRLECVDAAGRWAWTNALMLG